MGFKIQAYDVHVPSGESDSHIHFQVLTKTDSDIEKAMGFANEYLKTIDITDVKIESIAKLGHDQGAVDNQEKSINNDGYFILKVHPR